MGYDWFVFDLGNVVVKLAYERVLERICAGGSCSRDSLIAIMEEPGGYRDLERGAVSFLQFHNLLAERAGFKGGVGALKKIWSDFFDGPVDGIEEVLERVRERYRVAFLSNSNEVHEEVIPVQFAALFRRDDRFVFSHRYQTAKPDAELYLRACEFLETEPTQVIYVDDLLENVNAARDLGMHAFHFRGARELLGALETDGLL